MRHCETRLTHLLADVECLVDALAAAGQSR
jgi:hypothetical protein